MPHIDEIELEQLLDKTLPLLRIPLVKAHLLHCKQCQEKLEAIRKEKEDFRNLLPQLNRLNDADRQSEVTTMQTVSNIFTSKPAKS